MTWAKGFASSCLGSKVYVAEYKDDKWSSPVDITPDINFNGGVAIVFDSHSNTMTVWSSDSNEGLDYEKSSVEASDKLSMLASHVSPQSAAASSKRRISISVIIRSLTADLSPFIRRITPTSSSGRKNISVATPISSPLWPKSSQTPNSL